MADKNGGLIDPSGDMGRAGGAYLAALLVILLFLWLFPPVMPAELGRILY